jgi:hypothetical protein
MAAQNTSLEEEKAGFYTCFRKESGHLVFSTSPGGEGRVVSEDEAVRFFSEFVALADRHARRFGHSAWASVVLLILFGALGVKYGIPLFAGLALLSMFGWWFTAIAQRIIRARFKYRVWHRLEQRAPVRALSRHEKIARGFALSVRDWLWLGVAVVVYIALGAPPRALPPEWRDVQTVGIGVLMVGTLLALPGYGAVRLVRRLRGRG